MLFLQLLANGAQLGAIYALTAAGFSLIFGSTKIFHVAHGVTFTIAAYVFFWLYTAPWGHWSLALVGSAAAAVAFGVVLDRWVYGPIKRYEGSLFTVFVASFGAVVVVQNVVGMVFGRSFVSIPTPMSHSYDVGGGLYVAPLAGIAVVAAVCCFSALQFLFKRTHVGMALRALSENPELVRTYGMSPQRLSTFAFVIGSLLAVPAAIFSGSSAGMNPAIGHHIMLISMAATIVGGIGSMWGAACAGMLLGVAESVALWFFDPQWTEAVTFVVMFLFILFRPAGFFGRAVTT